MVLLDIEADTCSGCGHPLSETLQIDAYEGYDSGPPAVCQACKVLHRRQTNYVDDRDVHALRFTVSRTWEDPLEHSGDHFFGEEARESGAALPAG